VSGVRVVCGSACGSGSGRWSVVGGPGWFGSVLGVVLTSDEWDRAHGGVPYPDHREHSHEYLTLNRR
jgi:hypothetical protein